MKGIIVVPFNVPWIWSTDYLNQTAFELAKDGYLVVCYLWGDTLQFRDLLRFAGKRPLLSRYSKNIYVITPINFFPFLRFNFFADLNSNINTVFLRLVTEVIAFAKGIRRKIFWIFDPNMIFVLKRFSKKYVLVYDCVDFFAVGSRENIQMTQKNEKQICSWAQVITANSQVLEKHLKEYGKDVILVPQGFRSEGFEVKRSKYIDIGAKRPVIGFVGGINSRLDMSVLSPLIKNNPKWSFVLWGPVQKDFSTEDVKLEEIKEILKSPNVYSGVSSDKEEIPGLISQFDIGMIPYDISQDFNKYCFPMKLFEYLYMGKPIVSTSILELKRFTEFVDISDSYKGWEKIIKRLLAKKLSTDRIKKMKDLALSHSWEKKVSRIVNALESVR